MRTLKKVTTVALTVALLLSTTVTGVAAAEVPVSNSKASAGVTSAASITKEESGSTLAKYYSTNATGFGANKTISVDGDISDWNSSMLIAQGTANDDPRVYRPNSMYEVGIDLYALYGAYDDNNVYLMWEMTNVQDVVAPSDNYPLSQGVLWQTQELPFFIAVDTGKADTAIGNNGALTTGGTIWDSGMTLGNSFNKLISINTKGGNGPWVYGGNSSGLNPVEILDASSSKITMDYGLGILSDNVYGINGAYGEYNGRVPGDVCNDSADWVDFNTKGHSSDTMDFFYELSIPYSELGITKSDVQSNGIGVMLVATMGKSPMDCLPGDPVMTDQADLDDAAASQENNSYEKSDEDFITASFARIGSGTINPTETPTSSTTPTEAPTSSTTPTETPTAPVSNVTGQAQVTVNAGDVVTFTVDTTTSNNIGAYRITTNYDSSAFALDTSFSDDGVSTLGATSGMETINTTVAGQIKSAALATAAKPYTATSGATLQTVQLKATKAGTYTITYTVDEMIDNDENDLVTSYQPVSGVTFTEKATVNGTTPTEPTAPTDPTTPTTPEVATTAATEISVKAGDVVNYWVEVAVPSTALDVAGWTIDMFYDTNMFDIDESFADGYGFAAGTNAINYAIGESSTAVDFPGGSLAQAVLSDEEGRASITDANPNGLKFQGKTTKVVCVQLKAVKAGTTTISYRMRDLVDTNLEYTHMNQETLQAANGTTFALNNKITTTDDPSSTVKIFGDIDLELSESSTSGVYTSSIDLDAGTYAFKVNEAGTEMGNGYTFTDKATIVYSSAYKAYTTLNATGGTYTFSYNASTDKLTVTYEAFSGVKIFGDIELKLSESSTTGVYTGSIDLQAGTYAFKVNEAGTEMGNGYTFTDKATIVYSSAYKAYTTLNATGGTYTFSYNASTDKLTVTYKAFSGVKVFGDIELELSESDTEGVYTGSIDLDAGTYTFKINEAGTEMGFGYTFTDAATITYSSAYKSSTTLKATGGRYSFSYNTSTDKLSVTCKPFAEIVELFGDITIPLVRSSASSTVYTGSARIDAGTYNFKVNDQGVHKGFGYTFSDVVYNVAYNASYSSSTTFNATGGIYSVKYDASTSTLTFKHAPQGVGDVRVFGDINLDLVKDNGTIYSATQTLEAGTYEFRVDSFGKTLCNGGSFTKTLYKIAYQEDWKSATKFTAVAGKYTFRFDSSSNQLTVLYAPLEQKVSIFGDIELELSSTNGTTYTGKTTLAAGTYSFRIDDFGTTYCCGGSFTDAMGSVQYSTEYKSATTFTANGGTYGFSYNKTTHKLTVYKIA